MAKKKKPTLKSTVNRGFATTSTPSKKPEPAAAADAAESFKKVNTNGAAPGANGGPPGATAGAEAGNGQQSNATDDFEKDADEMELEGLVERLSLRSKKEVARLWKALEYDQRMAETFPTFELDSSVVAKVRQETDVKPSAEEEAAEAGPSTSLAPLPSTLLDEDKLYLKALITHGLIQQLGYTSAQADLALSSTTGAYDLEDCLATLVARLSTSDLAEAERRRKGLAAQTSVSEEESAPSASTDDTIPPTMLACSFQRRTGARGALASQSKAAARKEKEAAAAVPVSEEDALALTHELRQLALSSATLVTELGDALSAGQEGSGPMDTLEKPSLAWATARLAQIKLDRLKGQQKKLLRQGASMSAGYDASKMEAIAERLATTARESERARDFDPAMAAELLREQKMEWEAELRQEAQGEQEEANGGAQEADGDGQDETPSETQADGAESQQASKAPSEAGSVDGDGDGDMFGGLLDETPSELVDSSGVAVRVRPLPHTVKGGRTPRSLLAESLRRLDPASHVRYEVVATGGRVCRSRLTMRWPGPAGKKSAQSFIDVFELTGEATESQSSADDMLATLALNCVDRDRPTFRSLPGPYRDWYDEVERARKTEKVAQDVELMRKMRDILAPRLKEIAERKAAAKKAAGGESASASGTATPQQNDLGALASGSVKPLSPEAAERQRQAFTDRLAWPTYQHMLPQRQSLPIYQYRDHILDVLDSSQMFVLSAETGAGKSTQVPAYILEHCLSQGKPCKIYCTEPRRISAISLAERVSQELGERKGQVGTDDSLVGYAIRLDSHIGREAKLVYATSGILLRMLEGTSVNDVTHIVLDEVHERSIESDFLLIILKTLLQHRKDLKVILMSATLDAERLSAYCGGCPTISVPGRTFPVQTQYLEDAVQLTDYTIEDDSPYAIKPRRGGYGGRKANAPGNKANLQSTEDDDLDDDSDDEGDGGDKQTSKDSLTRYSPKTITTLDRMDEYVINHDLILSLIERICFSPDLSQYSAAILVFLPGIQDIRKLNDLILSHKLLGNPNAFIVCPLHSTLSSEEQSQVFEIPPEGMRKIVISTNIAETGVTIPDVTCVIDSGKHREMRFDEKRQTSRLVDCFVAKSNAKQRRGRAGRVQEGLCFHLFTKQRHDKYLADHPLPEMLRLSLQDLALKLKIMKIRIGNSIAEALSQALDPPSPLNVQRAVSALIEVKALTTTEEITSLGRHLARIPLDVHMGKFLLISSLFKCLDAALTIAAALNSKSPFVTPFGREAEADLAKASFRVGNSDFLTIANAFNAWRRSVAQKHHFSFCRKAFLSHQTLQQIEELRQQYMAFLLDSGFVRVDDATRASLLNARYRGGGGGGGTPRLMETPAHLDINGNSISVLHSALAVGLYPKLLAIDPKTYQLRTVGNHQPTHIHPSSVNFRSLRLGELPRGAMSQSHLVYFTIVQSRKLYAREVAPVSDAALVLLCGDVDVRLSCGTVLVDRNRVRFKVASSSGSSGGASGRNNGEDDGGDVGGQRTLIAVRALREELTKLIASSFKAPGRAWTREQENAFQLAVEAVGAFANEQDKLRKEA